MNDVSFDKENSLAELNHLLLEHLERARSIAFILRMRSEAQPTQIGRGPDADRVRHAMEQHPLPRFNSDISVEDRAAVMGRWFDDMRAAAGLQQYPEALQVPSGRYHEIENSVKAIIARLLANA